MRATIGLALALLVAQSCALGSNLPHSPTVHRVEQTNPGASVTLKGDVVLSLDGAGEKTTAPFDTSGPWAVVWTYWCSAPPGLAQGMPGNFIVLMMGSDGLMQRQFPAISQFGLRGNGTAYYTTPTSSTAMQLVGSCEWHVEVEQ
ncbi:MAG TPA: hypothetical protein VG476_04555 [Acidimicrobiales bacterium]|nr:hypothetical protein [Acidimicrobiales bacterium]